MSFTYAINVRRHVKIEHLLIIIAVAGVAIMTAGYLISPSLVERDREIFESLSFDDPNWLYYRDMGDAGIIFGISLWAGGVLIVFSVLAAFVYYLVRRGFTYKLNGNPDRFRLKGSGVE